MHYVISDIHGHHDKFIKLLKTISFSAEDRLFVLGDVIDRGPDPIGLLLHIMEMPNVTLLIGNHEHMMLSCKSEKDYLLWRKNGSQPTVKQFKELSSNLRDSVMEYLYNCPLAIPELCVNNRRYYLVHSAPVPFVLSSQFLYKNALVDVIEEAVWSRSLANTEIRPKDLFPRLLKTYRGTTLIIGHTATHKCSYGITNSRLNQPRISRYYHGRLINIDCGCSYGLNLGCLRLEDHYEFYVN